MKQNIPKFRKYKHVIPEWYKEKGEIKRLLRIASLTKGKILDIGYQHKPNPFLKNIYGIDIEKSIKLYNYKETKQVNFNKNKIPYKDKFFDSVILGETLEHIENLTNALSEIKRVLNNNGKLIISIPNPYYYMEIISNLFYKFNVDKIKVKKGLGHVHSFSPIELITLLKKYKFQYVTRYGTYIQIAYFKKPEIWVNLPSITKQNIFLFCKKRHN